MLSESERQAIIDTMVSRIVERVNPEKIILFGSSARGTAGAESDVDLMVVVKEKISKRKKASEIYTFLAGLGVPKDVVVVTAEEVERYKSIPGTVIYPAVHEGKVLYDRAA